MKKTKEINYWMIATIIILMIICICVGYIINQEIEKTKLKSMQEFYNSGVDDGAIYILNDYCSDGLLTIQDQDVSIDEVCDAIR